MNTLIKDFNLNKATTALVNSIDSAKDKDSMLTNTIVNGSIAKDQLGKDSAIVINACKGDKAIGALVASTCKAMQGNSKASKEYKQGANTLLCIAYLMADQCRIDKFIAFKAEKLALLQTQDKKIKTITDKKALDLASARELQKLASTNGYAPYRALQNRIKDNLKKNGFDLSIAKAEKGDLQLEKPKTAKAKASKNTTSKGDKTTAPVTSQLELLFALANIGKKENLKIAMEFYSHCKSELKTIKASNASATTKASKRDVILKEITKFTTLCIEAIKAQTAKEISKL